jgi:hypothetical protein
MKSQLRWRGATWYYVDNEQSVNQANTYRADTASDAYNTYNTIRHSPRLQTQYLSFNR